MLFNSAEFLVFLVAAFGIYWALGRRGQNLFLIGASYLFYGWWDWRFLGLIVASSVIDYIVGLALEKHEGRGKRRALLFLSLATNLGLLGFFKYWGFFTDQFYELLAVFDYHPPHGTLEIVLPVGISFYTFQTLSYTIDVYRKRIKATRDVAAFFAFVAFFPQLVAGPIERASHLLGQFHKSRRFDRRLASDGARQMLWGFFKKIVIADNLGVFVNMWYGDPGMASGPELWIGTYFFAFQIYCDFSGYSDIAIGCSRMFGFSLMRNFAYPYFSRDIPEFWRRWHISLSTWFRDYVYIPMGGRRVSKLRHKVNLFLTFVVSGFWHGASWRYIIWGALHGGYFQVLPAGEKGKWHNNVPPCGESFLPSFNSLIRMMAVFHLACFAWIFFAARSVGDAFTVIWRIPTEIGGAIPWSEAGRGFLAIGVLVCIEWIGRRHKHPLKVQRWPWALRWAVYYAFIVVILLFGRFGNDPFIYFQF